MTRLLEPLVKKDQRVRLSGHPDLASAVQSLGCRCQPGSVLMVAVGVVSMVTAVCLGLAVGLLAPSAFTAPVLTLLAVVGTVTLTSWQPQGYTGPMFSLLLPALPNYGTDFQIVSPRLGAVQMLWFLAAAATAFMVMATRGRTRLLAVLPVVLAGLVVVPQLPSSDFAAAYVTDEGATRLGGLLPPPSGHRPDGGDSRHARGDRRGSDLDQ
jgi:hypothetical protein